MRLRDILSEELIKIPLENTEKEKIIEELVDVLHQAKKVDNEKKVLKAVLEREKVMSTGVGDGVAIPHGKAEGVKGIVGALGITPKAVDFQSLDSKPVQLIFLLVGQRDLTGPHLKALSRISRLMHRPQFRSELLSAKTPQEAMKAIAREEEKCFEM